VIGWAVHVGRDAWFVSLYVLAFGLLARVLRSPGRGARIAWLAPALVAAFLAEAARQNAPPALLALFCAAVPIVATVRWKGWRRRGTVLAAGLAATVALMGVQYLIQQAVLRVDVQHPEQATYVADLARLSAMEHRMLLPADVYPAQDLAVLERWRATEDNPTVLLWGKHAIVDVPMHGAVFDSLRSAWASALTTYPIDYLHVRAHVELSQLAISRPATQVFQYPFTPPDVHNAFPAARHAALLYMNAFTTDDNNSIGGPIHAVWAYVLLVLLGTAWYLTRPGVARLLGSAGLGVLLFAAALFFVAGDSGYRYMYPVVVMGVAYVVVGLWDVGRWARTRI
jgi:hypothetical protein